MSGYQIIYAVLLLAAAWWGRPDWRLFTICAANFIGTMLLAGHPLSVGVLDMVAIALLIAISTPQAFMLVICFLLFIPIYVTGWALGLPKDTIYTIVNYIGYIGIPGVLAFGSGGGGSVNRRKPHRPRNRSSAGSPQGVAVREVRSNFDLP